MGANPIPHTVLVWGDVPNLVHRVWPGVGAPGYVQYSEVIECDGMAGILSLCGDCAAQVDTCRV